ncbi:MAG: hypothetical protein EA408_11010 [Marinilabiliales bacterium]|nr:MAG: hypothetical protein EA408_11010 [Marinilabiliales bacterium]
MRHNIFSKNKAAGKKGKFFFRLIYLALFILPGLSCNPEEWHVLDCSECYTSEPSSAEIDVRLTINQVNRHVVVRVYEGRIEEEVLIIADTVSTQRWSVVLPVNRYYTVSADYRGHSVNIITAIDGGFLRTEKIRTRCDAPCWIIRGNSFNVQRKYY